MLRSFEWLAHRSEDARETRAAQVGESHEGLKEWKPKERWLSSRTEPFDAAVGEPEAGCREDASPCLLIVRGWSAPL